LVDKAKTKIIIEKDMDGDEQNRCLDIWEDPLNKKLFTSGSLDINECTPIVVERAKKKVMRYHW
jgi:hypothetical protein